jgi:hypothetical protein
MIQTSQQNPTYNSYPRDVTSPGPYQRLGIVPSQAAAPNVQRSPSAPAQGDKNGTQTDQK